MFDKIIYQSLHFIMKHAGTLNAWAWRKHSKILRREQKIAMDKLVSVQENQSYIE